MLTYNTVEKRLSVLHDLCDSPKTSEAVDIDVLLQAHFFLRTNFNIQSSPFRQKLVCYYFRKIFVRVRNSASSILKQNGENIVQPIDFLLNYEKFLERIFTDCLGCLESGSNFARRSTSLMMLNEFQTTLCSDKIKVPTVPLEDNKFLSLLELESWSNSRGLIELINCLRDTYEMNQQLSLQILLRLPSKCLHALDLQFYQDLYKFAVRLACDHKPVSSDAAAFIFIFLAKRSLTITSSSSEQCQGLAMNNNYFKVFKDVIELLSARLLAVKADVVNAATHSPIFGILHCLQKLIENFDFGEDFPLEAVVKDNSWLKNVALLIDLCCEASSAVAPIVNNSSPEGHLPMDHSTFSSTNDVEVLYENDADNSGFGRRGVLSQPLLVSCWRTQREISAIFAALSSVFLAPKSVKVSEISLSAEQVAKMGDNFVHQLLFCKHRGAFETTYESFVKFCSVLWRCPRNDIRSFPESWLRKAFTDVKSGDSGMCVTRRSAGLPFMIQAILSTEPPERNEHSLQFAMLDLLDLALFSSSSETRVHSLNILRALIRECRLGEVIQPFISDCFRCAIAGFSSKNWMIRNSSTLVFSALMTRTFGVLHTKEIHPKNCLSSAEFYIKLPGLPQFLLNQLDLYLVPNNRRNDFPVFPVLLLLQRIIPSHSSSRTVAEFSAVKLEDFPSRLILVATVSPVFKIRALAAKAVASLVPVSDACELVFALVRSLSRNTCKQNETHGLLLIVQELLVVLLSPGFCFSERYSEFCNVFLTCCNQRIGNSTGIVSAAFFETLRLLITGKSYEKLLADVDLKTYDSVVGYKLATDKVMLQLWSPVLRQELLHHLAAEIAAGRYHNAVLKSVMTEMVRLKPPEFVDALRCITKNSSTAMLFSNMLQHAVDESQQRKIGKVLFLLIELGSGSTLNHADEGSLLQKKRKVLVLASEIVTDTTLDHCTELLPQEQAELELLVNTVITKANSATQDRTRCVLANVTVHLMSLNQSLLLFQTHIVWLVKELQAFCSSLSSRSKCTAATILKFSFLQKFWTLQNVPVNVFGVLFNLLIEDDADVREAVADCISIALLDQLNNSDGLRSNEFSLSSNVALEVLFFHCFVAFCDVDRKASLMLSALNIIVDLVKNSAAAVLCHTDCEMTMYSCGERVFDKNDNNYYVEVYYLAKMLLHYTYLGFCDHQSVDTVFGDKTVQQFVSAIPVNTCRLFFASSMHSEKKFTTTKHLELPKDSVWKFVDVGEYAAKELRRIIDRCFGGVINVQSVRKVVLQNPAETFLMRVYAVIVYCVYSILNMCSLDFGQFAAEQYSTVETCYADFTTNNAFELLHPQW